MRLTAPPGAGGQAVEEAALRVRRCMRGQDILGFRSAGELLLALPDTDLRQARRAAERLLGEAAKSSPDVSGAAGVATGFGDVEGGCDALLDAAARALEKAPPAAVVCSDAVPGPRVLVVDDDELFAQLLADIVTDLGWEGEPCSDPIDALHRVREGVYYGLFVDLVLPRLSGVTILREFLAAPVRRPAILMSGADAKSEAVLEAISLGPVMFLGKPPSRQDIESALTMFRALLPGAQR
jgi:PleD family two-component response regulator